MKGDRITIQHVGGGPGDPPTLTLTVIEESAAVILAEAGTGALHIAPLFTVMPDGTLQTSNGQQYRIVRRNGVAPDVASRPEGITRVSIILLVDGTWRVDMQKDGKLFVAGPVRSIHAALDRARGMVTLSPVVRGEGE